MFRIRIRSIVLMVFGFFFYKDAQMSRTADLIKIVKSIKIIMIIVLKPKHTYNAILAPFSL